MKSEDDEKSVHEGHFHYHRARDSRTNSESSVDRPEKPRRHCEKDLVVIHVVNEHFREAQEYRNYRLEDKSSHYDDKVVRSVTEWVRRLQVQQVQMR